MRWPGMPVLIDKVGSDREVALAQHHAPTSDIHVLTLDFSLQRSDRRIGKEMRVESRAEDCLCFLPA